MTSSSSRGCSRGGATAREPRYFTVFPGMGLSLGGELRYQRWLSTPSTVTSEELRDNLTLAAGPRFHIKPSDKVVIRPGLSYSFALDAPMKAADYSTFQLDVPVNF